MSNQSEFDNFTIQQLRLHLNREGQHMMLKDLDGLVQRLYEQLTYSDLCVPELSDTRVFSSQQDVTVNASPLGTDMLVQDAAAAYLKCSRSKFWRLRKTHQISHYRHGGTLYFLKTDLDAYLRNLKANLSK